MISMRMRAAFGATVTLRGFPDDGSPGYGDNDSNRGQLAGPL